jgi:hypothetical protein
MKSVVFSRHLIRKEQLTQKEIEIIVKVCKKDIFTKIKGENIPDESSLVKIYVTTIEGARRLVLLFDEKTNVKYFLFFRKKDDPIGKNVSIKNPKFKEKLYQYLRILDEDMMNDNFEIVEF